MAGESIRTEPGAHQPAVGRAAFRRCGGLQRGRDFHEAKEPGDRHSIVEREVTLPGSRAGVKTQDRLAGVASESQAITGSEGDQSAGRTRTLTFWATDKAPAFPVTVTIWMPGCVKRCAMAE